MGARGSGGRRRGSAGRRRVSASSWFGPTAGPAAGDAKLAPAHWNREADKVRGKKVRMLFTIIKLN